MTETLKDNDELKIERTFSKITRKMIKNPKRLCDNCLDEYVHQTVNGNMLCELCHEEYLSSIK